MKRNTGKHRRRYPPTVPQPKPEDVGLELIWEALATPGGYQGPPTPRQFRGAGSRGKSYCPPCDLVLRGSGTCPQCHGEAVLMSKNWRPGRKGHGRRIWDARVSHRRRQYSGIPDVVYQLGVTGLPPQRRYRWDDATTHR